MPFPANKTKIVCTIGPASDSREVLEKLIHAGMNIARLNFSHGDFERHGKSIQKIRDASKATKRRVAIMADLPGPKIRIGELETESIELESGAHFTLTTADIAGNQTRVSVSFSRLPKAVKPKDRLFINDGLVELEVEKVEGQEVRCTVVVGGTLRSGAAEAYVTRGVRLTPMFTGLAALAALLFLITFAWWREGR